MFVAKGNIKIGTRIFIGFGVILAVLIGLVLFTNNANDVGLIKQAEFERRVSQMEVLLESKAALIEVRRAVTLFLVKGGPLTEIDAGIKALEKRLETSRDGFKRQERKEAISDSLKNLQDYRQGVDQLALVRENKDEFPKALEVLRAAGQSIQDHIETLSKALGADLSTSQKEMEATTIRNKNVLKTSGIISVLVGLIIAFLIGRGITGPIKNMTSVMARLADGELTIDVPNRENKDEIGQMARAVEVFKDNALKVEAMRADKAKAEEREAQERRQAMLDMAEKFEASVMGVVKNVSSSATEMQTTAKSMSKIAQETSAQATAVAAASTEASTNVETVAAAAEELSASTSEIGSRVTEAARVSQKAAEEGVRTNEMVQKLLGATTKIGEVVSLINEIASQTNLLALNATIEAARAGDAGKGFAVVAGEVKNLASQTAKATDEIGTQINEVQTETRNAVEAIKTITGIIDQIRGISSNIASAVEEQGAATQEIARNVQQAAQGTHEVSSNIVSVTQASTQTGAAAEQVLASAGELSKNAELLREEVEGFLSGIRNG